MTRAQEPLRHAERLALWHAPVRIRRRRPWWPRVAAVLLLGAIAVGGLASVAERPVAVVIRAER